MINKKKKSLYIFLIILILIIIGLLIYMFSNNKFQNKKNEQDNGTNHNISRLAQESNILGNNERLNAVNNRISNVLDNANKPTKEEELSSYSTKVSGSTENRLTNIRITCNKLNGKTVKSGDTFSFCDTTGPSTAEEGYKEATVFHDGKKIQALGGGNCQISSTLYNAVLEVSDLNVIERHEHGQDVSYVPDGKDAAVAYGSIDFRFENNTGNNIKLYFSTDDETLTVRIVKLV